MKAAHLKSKTPSVLNSVPAQDTSATNTPPKNLPKKFEKPVQELSAGVSFPIVAIGASAGGLEAFSELLRYLPSDTGMAFVFIQHLAPKHVSMLAPILTKSTTMPVLEVKDGMPVEPNHIYVIPPNTCMTISEGILKLKPRSEEHAKANLPIDVFFRSLAEYQKSQAIGIILSGTASDGSSGIAAIKEEGGITFAQEEKSAKFEQMPQNAIATGCVDFVLAPEDIAKSLAGISSHPYANPSELEVQTLLPETDEPFRQIVILLKKASGVDFACYKPATIKRRIIRRMVLNKKETLKEYLDILKSNPHELETLHQDVLIKVTRFFRDSEIFEVLKKDVYPHIASHKSNETPLRIWVPGCSTGEEVYSIAISLLEFLGDQANHLPIQFFGSDIKENCIQAARAGIYPENISHDVSGERLKQYFNKVDQGYQIAKSIRDRCIFAKQNVTADPPFSRIDFISCRNLLIYLNTALQKKVIPTFHYALNPDGFLLLGQSETVMGFQDLFKSVNQKARIYSKKPAQAQQIFGSVDHSPYIPERFPVPKPNEKTEASRIAINAQKEADRVIMAKYEQAGVVVNEAMEILQFRGDTSHYLKQAPGTPSLNFLKMLREGLLAEFRVILNKVIKEGPAFKKENIRMKYNGDFKNVSIEIIPLKVPAANQRHFLVLFGETGSVPVLPKVEKTAGKRTKQPELKTGSRMRDLEMENRTLKEELVSTKSYMQSIIEERERANEELQAAHEEVVSSNEELQSMNEEMQSANEELQTAKEELQASNEEITTINDEVNNRNTHLTQISDDLGNLLNSIQLPIVMVGNDLLIRRFTPASQKVISLAPSDVGRSISDIKLKVNLSNLEELILQVIKDLTIKEQEVQDEKGCWYSLQIRPYRTSDNKIDGVVITFADIDALKTNQRLMEEHKHYLEGLIQTISVPLLVLDSKLQVKLANEAFYRTFQVKPEQTENSLIYKLGNKQWDIPKLRELLEDILPGRSKFENYEVDHVFESVGHKIMLLNACQIDSIQVILLSIEDITERKQRERRLRQLNAALEKQGQKLQKSNVELEQFAAVASHDLKEPFHIISSFMGLLASSYKDKLEPKAQELIKIAEDAAGRAQDLISSLLDYARVDSGERTLEAVDIKSVVHQALSDLRNSIEESSADIIYEPLPKIMGDRLHLTRLFQNLISNAIKYRSERPLKINISARKENAEWIFQIKDNGVGFDRKDKARVFEMFRRLQGREISGVGIGLATCKKIVERHGGKIWAESEPGKGSSFYFSIPEVIAKTKDGL